MEVLHSLPSVRQYLFSLYECRYSIFFQSLGMELFFMYILVINIYIFLVACNDPRLCVTALVEQEMKKDWLFAPHYRYYVREMRIQAYSQLLESYRSLTLGYMAEAFGVSTEFIDQ